MSRVRLFHCSLQWNIWSWTFKRSLEIFQNWWMWLLEMLQWKGSFWTQSCSSLKGGGEGAFTLLSDCKRHLWVFARSLLSAVMLWSGLTGCLSSARHPLNDSAQKRKNSLVLRPAFCCSVLFSHWFVSWTSARSPGGQADGDGRISKVLDTRFSYICETPSSHFWPLTSNLTLTSTIFLKQIKQFLSEPKQGFLGPEYGKDKLNKVFKCIDQAQTNYKFKNSI